MLRPVMYWSFAKRSMTSSMDLNMQGNPRARRPASERTLTHGLGQDNQSRAGARRVRGSDGGSARPPRYGLRIVLAVVLLPHDVAARLVLLVADGAPLLPGDLPVGGGLLAVRLHLLLLRLELGRLLRRHLPAPDALLDAGVLALLAPVDDAGGRQGGREHEDGCGGGDRESLHGGSLASPRVTLKRAACIGRVTRSGYHRHGVHPGRFRRRLPFLAARRRRQPRRAPRSAGGAADASPRDVAAGFRRA